MRLPCVASSVVCVFVDVDERTYGIAPARLEVAIIRVKAEADTNRKSWWQWISLSFPTATCWEYNKVQLRDVADNVVTVLNIAAEKSIGSIILSYKKFEQREQYMKDFSDLLDSNKTHFTNLKFSDRIDKQLDSLDKCFFSEVLKALCDIECLFSFYDVTPNKIKSLFPKCSGESETVRNNPKLKNERSFSFDGEQIECLEHIKFNDGLRIHYHANFKDRICYIGYIGRHLPTARYSH